MNNEQHIRFGLHSSGRVLHILQVAETGLACDCVCTGCKMPLVAYKNTTKRVQHFSHASLKVCRNAAETALHSYAKQVVTEELRIVCPVVVLDDGESRREIATKSVLLDRATTEVSLGPLTVDVLAYVAGGLKMLVIEVAVTHESEEKKLEELERRGIAAIEIDVSQMAYDSSPDEIRRAVTETAPRRWLFNPREAIASRARSDRLRISASLNAQPVLDMLAQDPPAVSSDTAAITKAVKEVVTMQLGECIGITVTGGRVFSYELRSWQAHVLCAIVDKGDPITPERIMNHRLIRTEILGLRDDGLAVVRESYPDFDPPATVVWRYITELVNRGFLGEQGRTRPSVLSEARRRRREAREEAEDRARIAFENEEARRAQLRAERDEREAAKRAVDEQRRHEAALRVARNQLWKIVEPLLERVPEEDRLGFSFEGWLALDLEGRSPLEWMTKGEPWSGRFADRIQRLSNLFTPDAALAESLLGLPLQAAQAERTVDHERRQEEKAENEANDRMADLRMTASRLKLDEAWLEQPHVDLGMLSPIDEARKSPDGLERALDAASQAHRQWQEGEKTAVIARNILREVATQHLGIESGYAWMSLTSNKLGRIKPIDHCRDRVTLKQCLDTLQVDSKKLIPRYLRSRSDSLPISTPNRSGPYIDQRSR